MRLPSDVLALLRACGASGLRVTRAPAARIVPPRQRSARLPRAVRKDIMGRIFAARTPSVRLYTVSGPGVAGEIHASPGGYVAGIDAVEAWRWGGILGCRLSLASGRSTRADLDRIPEHVRRLRGGGAL